MGDISKHFNRAEFACKCGCGFDTVDAELLKVLEDIRIRFGCPIRITGPNRCEPHNEMEGGAEDSQHIYARAADFKLIGDNAPTPAELYEWLQDMHPNRFGIGLYSNRIHLDTRSEKARWTA